MANKIRQRFLSTGSDLTDPGNEVEIVKESTNTNRRNSPGIDPYKDTGSGSATIRKRAGDKSVKETESDEDEDDGNEDGGDPPEMDEFLMKRKQEELDEINEGSSTPQKRPRLSLNGLGEIPSCFMDFRFSVLINLLVPKATQLPQRASVYLV